MVPQRRINPWIVTCAVMSATFMEVLDTTVVNVAIPHIAGNLSSTTDEGTWAVTSYLVSNAIVLPMSGWLANFFGRRRMLITCVLGFALTSLLCGLATSLEGLIFFRVLQGLTGGGMVPLAQSIMLESFPPKKHGIAMAAYGVGILFAPIIGPTLGGWITDNYSWRWIFYINVPIGLLSVVMMARYVWDPPYVKRPKGRIDYWGILFLALGFGALQIVLDTGQKNDWFASQQIRVFTFICVFGLVGMVVRELMAEHPIMDIRALKERTFAAGVFLMTTLGFVLYGSLILLPIYLQTLLGYPALDAGLAMSPRGVSSLLVMPLVGVLTSRTDPRKLVACGLSIGAFSMWQLSRLSLDAGFWDILWPQVVQGISLAFLFVPLAAASMSHIAKHKMGNASAIFNLMRNIGGSLGIAAMTTLLSRRQQFHQNRLIENITPYDLDVRIMMEQMKAYFMSRGSDAYTATKQATGAIYGMVQKHAAMMSFVDAFWMLAVVFAVVIPLVILQDNPNKRHEAEEKAKRKRRAEKTVEEPELVMH
jgi:MFS transporter, DHA2 family, multidrug resistance protein